jgi:hypothetical protein
LSADHYKFIAEYFRLQQLMAQKYLKRELEENGYRARMKIVQDL